MLSSWLLMKVPEVVGVGFAKCLTTSPVCRHLRETGQVGSGGGRQRIQGSTDELSLSSPYPAPQSTCPSGCSQLKFLLLGGHTPCLPSRLTDGYSKCCLEQGNAEIRNLWAGELLKINLHCTLPLFTQEKCHVLCLHSDPYCCQIYFPCCGYGMVPFKPCLAGPWEVALLGLQVISSSSSVRNCCQL